MPKAKEKKDETYSLNVYKLQGLNALEDLGLHLQNSLQGFKTLKNDNIVEYKDKKVTVLYFAYVNQNPGSEIEWFNKWKQFFQIDQSLRNSNITGHGILVFYLEETDEYYVATFGRSFNLVKKFIEPEYGIKMASTLYDGKAIDSISSKYFSLTKNKSLLSFNGEHTFSFAEGEAIDLLRASITEYPNRTDEKYITELLKLVRQQSSIGFSNIKLTIQQKEIVLENVIDIILLLSKIENEYKPRFDFPKMKEVKQEDKKTLLNSILLQKIKDKDNSITINIPFYTKDNNDEHIFLSCIDCIKLRFGHTKEELFFNFNKVDLFEFVDKHSEIDDITKIKINAETDDQIGNKTSILNWIDAQIEIEDDKNIYALNNGMWVCFNDNYLERINKKIKEIEHEVIIIDNSFSISDKQIEIYFLENKQDIMFIYNGNDEDKDTCYREFKYNYQQSKIRNWHLFDRVTFNNIEVCDMYDPRGNLIHCKIGDTSKLEECIRQSLYGIKYYFTRKEEVTSKKNKRNENIQDVNTVEVLYLKEDSDVDNFLLSDLKSIKCKLTFLDWYDTVKSMKLIPKLRISNFKNKNKKTD